MDESIVFFGSGPLAAAALQFLDQHFHVEAVVTKPTTQEAMSAAAVGAALHAVSNKQELSELITAKKFESRVAVLVDFGIIVERAVIDTFPLGIINSHFSLLPRWRGADPISFAILEGDTKTGVSLMLIDEHMDTGKLLTQKTLHIKPGANTPSLTDELIDLSNRLLLEWLPRYVRSEVKPRSQPHPDRATYSRKLTKEDGVLDWTKPAAQLEREVRAFRGWPGSRTTLAGKEVTITAARVAQMGPATPGQLMSEKNRLFIGTGQDWLEILSLKPAGKKEMPIRAFLAGYGQKI